MTVLTYERAAQVLTVTPEGVLIWKASRWKSRLGKPAGCKHSGGYVVVQIDGSLHFAHRIVWLLTHGVMPTGDIDHINGKRDDNRPSNLRDVSRAENVHNIRGAYCNNATGVLGAHPCKKTGRFTSSIRVNGKSVFLGRFDTAEEAHAAFVAAKAEHHPGFIQATRAAA